MKYQDIRNWQNNPKVRIMLIVAVVIKLVIVLVVLAL
jgi:hypothetical protein